MNLPNQITVARLFLSAVLFAYLELVCRQGAGALAWYIAFTIYMVTVLSDGLDGYLARSRGQVTAFGRIADPLADKIVISGVMVFGLAIPATTALVPAWLIVLVLAREFLVSGLRGYIEAHGASFGARWEGKTKLVVQAVFCGAILFYPGHYFTWVWWVATISMWATAAITVYTAATYMLKAKEVIQAAHDA